MSINSIYKFDTSFNETSTTSLFVSNVNSLIISQTNDAAKNYANEILFTIDVAEIYVPYLEPEEMMVTVRKRADFTAHGPKEIEIRDANNSIGETNVFYPAPLRPTPLPEGFLELFSPETDNILPVSVIPSVSLIDYFPAIDMALLPPAKLSCAIWGYGFACKYLPLLVVSNPFDTPADLVFAENTTYGAVANDALEIDGALAFIGVNPNAGDVLAANVASGGTTIICALNRYGPGGGNIGIAAGGRMEWRVSPPAKPAAMVNSVLCLASAGDQLFAGTDRHGILLRSITGGFWENFYYMNDAKITAVYVNNGTLFVGTSPLGQIYTVALTTNITTFSQTLGGNIVSFAGFNGKMYVANTTNGIYQYNPATLNWDFFYQPCGTIRRLKVLNGQMYVILNSSSILVFDGTHMNLIGVE